MRDVEERTEDQRWEEFIEGLATLVGAPPDVREEFIDKIRPVESREMVFRWSLNRVFPALTVERRQQFARLAHVLES